MYIVHIYIPPKKKVGYGVDFIIRVYVLIKLLTADGNILNEYIFNYER